MTADPTAQGTTNALRDIADICAGWSRPMTDSERLACIATITAATLATTSAGQKKPRPFLLCPSCGKEPKYLEEHTGFCQTCTNEHRRGSGPRK